MNITLRDLTLASASADVSADVSGEVLSLNLNPEHEYIIVDHDDVLNPEEFTSLAKVKKVLETAKKNNITEDILRALSLTYLFNEIAEMAEKNFEEVSIIDFSAETKDWNEGTGAYASDSNIGLVLYNNGYNAFGCKIPEMLEDYIMWEQNWYAAESEGYRFVSSNGTDYIVRWC